MMVRSRATKPRPGGEERLSSAQWDVAALSGWLGASAVWKVQTKGIGGLVRDVFFV